MSLVYHYLPATAALDVGFLSLLWPDFAMCPFAGGGVAVSYVILYWLARAAIRNITDWVA